MSHAIYPLAAIDPASETFAKDCTSVAKVFIAEPADNKDAHWVEAARDLMTSLIIWESRNEDAADGQSPKKPAKKPDVDQQSGKRREVNDKDYKDNHHLR